MIDASIPLQVKPPQSPMDQYGRVLAIQNALGQQQVQQQQIQSGQIQLQQQQQDQQDQQVFRKILADTNASLQPGENLYEKAMPKLAGNVSPKLMMSLQEASLKHQKELAEKEKIDIENQNKKDTFNANALNVIADQKDPVQQANLYGQYRADAIAKGMGTEKNIPVDFDANWVYLHRFLSPEVIKQNNEAITAKSRETDSATRKAELLDKRDKDFLNAASGAQSQQQLDQMVSQAKREGVTVGAISRVPAMFSPQSMQQFGRTLQTAEQRVQSDQAAANATETKSYHEKELANAAERIGLERGRLFQDKEETKLSPEAVGKMSEMFATTGQLPTLGMGKNAAAMRSQIINQAAKDYPTVQFATNQAAFQANKASLSSLQKQTDSITAYEKSAGKNLDQFLQTAKGVVDSGSPWINKPLRSIASSALGSTDQAAFNTAREVATAEIARILTASPTGGGVVSDSARQEAQGLLGPNATLKQIYRASEILRADMKNRLQSSNDQIKAINERITVNPTAPPKEQSSPKASYSMTATAPSGHKIGSNDGKSWFDLETGKPIK